MLKRVLVLFLCLVLLLGNILVVGFAAEISEVTRAQWIQMLVETFDMTVEEDNYPDNYYSDLSGEEDYYRDILVAVEFGVIDLAAGLPFRPEDAATREFAAHTLNYALGFQVGEDVAYTFAEAEDVTYPDDIQVAVNRGWFALTDGKFYPEQAITCAERDAMRADAEAVLTAEKGGSDSGSTYVYADGVKSLPDNTAAQLESETTLVIAGPETPIYEGDIFALTIDGLPYVFLADAVSVDGAVYSITVTQQDLMSYLISSDAEGSLAGDLSKFEVAEGWDVIYVLEDGTRTRDVRAAGTKKIKNIHFSEKYGDLSVTIELYDMYLKWHSRGNIFDKTSIDVGAVVSGKTYCYASLPFGASVSDFSKDLVLGSYPIGSFGAVTVSANISIDGSITVTYGANFKAGIEYSYSGGFRIPREFKKTHFSITVEATVDYSLTLAASISGVPFLYGQCSATIGMKTNFVAKYRGADVTPTLCIHTDSWVYARARVYASAGIDAPKIPGAENFKETWTKTITIWDRNSSPVRSISHFEDGEIVNSCTYGETNYFGYNNSYYTPSGSRYENGGVSAVSNVPAYTYTVNEEGNATITGYSGSVASISIPATIDGHPVVAIAENAFKNNTGLTSVTMPAGVVSIGSEAFSGCINLKSVVLPSSLTEISSHLFYGCSSLVYIEIPDSVVKIDSKAFAECSGLQRILLPKQLIEMSDSVFENCRSLTNITIPKTLTTCSGYNYYAENGIFYGCVNLKTVILEDGMTTIPACLLQGSSIETITIPDSVTQIGGACFRGCERLKEIIIPDSVTVIGSEAFLDCTNLQRVVLPKQLVEMSNSVFENCRSLTNITIPKTLTTCSGYNYYAENGIFYGCVNLKTVILEDGMTTIPACLLQGSSIETITIPTSVTKIGGACFRGCEGLKEIIIPDSVTVIGSEAFLDCTNLEKIILPSNLTILGDSEWEGNLFGNCTSLTEIVIPKTLTQCVGYNYYANYGFFYGCTNLKTVILEDGMKRIPDCLLQGSSIETITIPDSVTEIGAAAFRGCTELKNITIPASVTKIGNEVFSNTGFTEFILPDTVLQIGTAMFSDCGDLKTFTWNNTVSSIPDGTFKNCVNLEVINIPDVVTQFGEASFYNCDSLAQLQIPSNVTTIKQQAFYDADALVEITIPDGVISIEQQVFYDCDALTSVAMGNAVTSMGASIFEHCDVLKNVILSRKLASIPEAAFKQCAELAEITIPYYATSIGKNAFKDSPKLVKVTVPRGLTSIDSTAFSYADRTVFYGVSGTYAETWANDNGYQFVAQEVAATEISLNKNQLELNQGASEALILTVIPEGSTDEIVWKSANTAVATVTNQGVVKAVGVGTTTIKVTVGSLSASCKLTVVQPVTSISLNKTSLSLQALQNYQLQATISPSNANNKEVTWSSSDETVATVDENGLITTLAKGRATITVTAADGSGVSRTCAVTVTNTGYVVSEPAQMESSHNYPNNCTDFWIYSLENAEELEVTFDEKTELEDGFDYLYVYDGEGTQVGKYTGSELSGKTITVPGNTVKIQIASDSSGNEWGFKVTQIVAAETEHTHIYEADVTAPTCTEKGFTTYTCSCGDTYVADYVEALTHDMGDWTTTKEATCTEEGAKARSCKRDGCEYEDTETIDATGHAWDDGVVTKKPTSEEDGICIYTCKNCGITREESVPASNLTIPAKPYKIANVVSGVHVYWKDTEGAEKYGLWRSETGKDGEYKWIANPTVPHFTDAKVESGKTYFYKVTSMDSNGKHSEKSEAIGVTYVFTPDITSRKNVAAGVELGWEKIVGATGYAIYRKSYDGNDAWMRIGTIPGNETFIWTDESVKNGNGEIYRYTIRALAGSDMKTLSGCRNTGRTMARLSSQVITSATKASANSVLCKWTTSSRVTGYEVRFTAADGTVKTFTVGNYKTGIKTFTGLKAGQEYTVQVRTYKKVDGVGSFYSDWSSAKTVKI